MHIGNQMEKIGADFAVAAMTVNHKERISYAQQTGVAAQRSNKTILNLFTNINICQLMLC